MSDNVDWTIIVRNLQQAARSADAAMEIAEGMKADLRERLTAIETCLTCVETRLSALAAGQDSLHRTGLRIADAVDAISLRLGRRLTETRPSG